MTLLDTNDDIELVCQLDERDNNSVEYANQLEDLLRKSRQFNSSKSIRIIDQQIENVELHSNRSIESLVLTCNKLARDKPIDWTQLPNHLKVHFHIYCSLSMLKHIELTLDFRIICQFPFVN